MTFAGLDFIMSPLLRVFGGLSFFWIFTFGTAVRAAAQSVDFESLTIEHGLSQGMIYDLCQTRDGFLWVATKDGLNRYDGYNFKLYSHNPLDSFSLAEDNVTALFEDSRGLLWVGLESKGIDVYDPKTGRFHHCPLNFEHNQKPADFDVYAICEAVDGTISCLQKANGLVRVAVPTGYLAQGDARSNRAHALKATLIPTSQFGAPVDQEDKFLTAVRPQPDGSLQVYTNRSAYRVQPGSDGVEPLSVPVADDFWVSLPFGLAHCRNGALMPQNLSAFGKLNWTMAVVDADGSSWVAFNNKLWHLQPGEVPDFSAPHWVVDQDISTATADRNGNIWVGTQGYGLRKFNPQKQRFYAGAAGKSIWGLWRDLRGKYYCKVVNQVFVYDPLSKTLSTQHAFPQGPDRVLDICIDPNGDIWLLGRDNADDGMGTLQHYSPDATLIQSFRFTFKSYVYARLIRSRDGNCWITGMDCQLTRFSPASAQFDYFSYASVFGEMSRAVRALALAEDGNGKIWIGTQEGLVHFDPKSFAFQLMRADLTKPNSLSNNVVLCLLPDPADPEGVLWVGTKGGGINRLDLKDGQFHHITTADGLPDKVVYGILSGQGAGEFWCSTNRGLAKIRVPSTPSAQSKNASTSWAPGLTITTYTAAKGLQDNEFNTQAFFKAANGELLFGGVNGLNRFFPGSVRPDTLPPPVFIVGLEVNHAPATYGASGLLEKPLELLRELQLSYDQNNLSFEFAALDFTDPAKNRYRYQMVGLDADWVETGSRRFAHFNHLAAGTYTFRVQGNNGEGLWRDAANPIIVVIHPPWWRTRLAYLLYAALFAWAGWQAYRFQMRRVRLSEQLAYEHRETERVKALEQMKTDFFSNITHEFRTPLTLILEPARRILAKTTEPETRDNARLVEANSLRLLSLVNKLLDMAKLEVGGLSLDLRHGNLSQTVQQVARAFAPLAEQRGVNLNLQPHSTPDSVFDAEKVELVLNNLIFNALKFTPQGGEVNVAWRVEDGDPAPMPNARCSIQVKDTGIGIPPEALDKIFDRFFQVERQGNSPKEIGTGIGLALSRELAELMGGSISVESEVGKGSTFTFWIPVTPPSFPSAAEGAQISEPMAPPSLVGATEPMDGADPSGDAGLVLLIEDNAELRGFIRQCISRSWQVAEASDGAEGVEKAITLVPDLVISDVAMPRKDGFAVCDELKNNELTAHIPIMLLTAKSATDSKIKGLRTGADDYLTKPFNTDELLARMDNLVETRRRLQQRYRQQVTEHHFAQNIAAATERSDFLTAPDRDFLQRFVATVEQHLSDEHIGVEDFAQKMHLSRVQLHRKLKALTDQNVSDFVRDHRLDRAMAMLKNREGMVYEVASRVGFGSEKYFSRAFKDKFGVPPSQIM